MNREQLDDLSLAIALTAIAGYVDGIGFLTLKHLFVSFMSGNSTQFAVAAADRSWGDASSAAMLVVLFVIGVSGGHLLGIRVRAWRRPVILVTEAALLTLGSYLSTATTILAVPIVLAMGMQNTAQHQAGETRTNLTYVTGTLVSFGEKLVDALGATDSQERWAWAPYLLLWAGLVLGAAAGTSAYRLLQMRALLIAVGALLVLAAMTAHSVRREMACRRS
jgi:uncharacterized membrane protein YoaK (UPF0700 family)